MIYHVNHRSVLSYAAPVFDARINLRLKPVAWPGQSMRDYRLEIDPMPASMRDEVGPYVVNTLALNLAEALSALTVVSSFTMQVDAPVVPQHTPSITDLRQQALAVQRIDALAPAPYLYASRLAAFEPDIAHWAATSLTSDQQVLDGALDLARRIYREFAYVPGATSSSTSPADAFRAREGVCQDFAQVMIVALRSFGIPAAYVSGYLRTIPPPGRERLVGADAMHAWVAVWCGDAAGWVGIDPTNDCLTGESHITVAMGRDYADVAPVDGVFVGQSVQRMKVQVDVAPLD
ncbi:transglutaminase family protein [Altererythrobacter xixiisoli]|uniref:Transglutaminase family protein n=1 Tax=Croceibacterium xixiisoli TaxID=1476466 RepID=A0A6I4TUW6_9SPHN|nr:transglutaminase family protein [Croceibacterium xixiisoli]MXO98358.1 transglutaminase family protein [Croceibacterium xixiisoli]